MNTYSEDITPKFNNLWEIIQNNPKLLNDPEPEYFNNNIDNLKSNLFEVIIYGHDLSNKIDDNMIEKNTIQGLKRPYPQWFDGKNCCTGLIKQNFHSSNDNSNLVKSCVAAENIYVLDKSVVPPAGPHTNENYQKQYDFIDRKRLGNIWGKIKADIKNTYNISINKHESAHSAFSKYFKAKICIYAPPFSGKTTLVTDLRNHGIPATETDISPTINQTYLDCVLLSNNPKYLRIAEIKIAIIPTYYEFSKRLGYRKIKNDKNEYLRTIKRIPKDTKIIFSDDYIGQLIHLQKYENRAKLIIKNDDEIIGKNWYFSKDDQIEHEIF